MPSNANHEIVLQFGRMMESMRDVIAASAHGPQAAPIRRICLHSIEAIENYFSDQPPANYGGALKYGIRSREGQDGLDGPALLAYLEEVGHVCQGYLDGVDLTQAKDRWGKPPLGRILYVMRHTQHHLGQISRLAADAYDINRLCRP